MRKSVLAVLCAFAACVCIILCAGSTALASEQFYDGKLEISGFAKETMYYRTSWEPGESHYRDSRIDYAMTSLYFESIYKLKESPEMNITWFNGLKYWYEATTSLDDTAHHFVPSSQRRDYQQSTQFEDILTESYLSFTKGPWDIRVGKQIVIWGQLDVNRVADVVNPLDLRRGVPGVDSWEEIKQGLWMIRTVYQSSLPGNLIFENIINPGYYQNAQIPYEGTHWGSSFSSVNTFSPNNTNPSIFWWNQSKWNRDAPCGWSTDNWELGFRLQGYTYDIDWSLIYWNAKSDGPVADASRATAYGLNYVFPGIIAGIQGGNVHPRDWKGGEVFRYKRYQTFGGTAQTVIQPLHNSVWRLEWFYELDSPFNTGKDNSNQSLTGIKRQDVGGIAIQYNDKFEIPWFTQAIGTGKFLDVSMTYFIERIFNMDPDLVIETSRNHRKDDPNAQSLSLFLKQEMFNTSWVFVFTGSYYPMIKKWFAVPCFTYMFPGEHWRADLGYKAYGGSNNEYVGDAYAHKDSVILRLRYEF
jgi:hypothetical protein